ncbi:MAG: hypothetical protein QOJ15_9044 [Bradyrhizobium sp.]|jgi:hypothetical protein|nr:hypothetical protein [Bradyrhizobium sp.]
MAHRIARPAAAFSTEGAAGDLSLSPEEMAAMSCLPLISPMRRTFGPLENYNRAKDLRPDA